MLQSDGEPAWQVKTYNALEYKKYLTGINKEGILIGITHNLRGSIEWVLKIKVKWDEVSG